MLRCSSAIKNWCRDCAGNVEAIVQIKQLYVKFTENLWVQAAMAVFIVFNSSFDILKDITHLHKEHGELIIGIAMLLKAVMELRERVERAEQVIKEARHIQ